MMKKFLLAVPVLTLAIGGSTACATKKFVRTEVGGVNDKVTTLSGRLEAERAAHEGERGRRSARSTTRPVRSTRRPSPRAAAPTRRSGRAAGGREGRRDRQGVAQAGVRVVLSEAQGGFKFGRAALPDEAKAQLDKLVTDISADPKNVFFEIEGHTDSAGSASSTSRSARSARNR